MYIIFVQAIFLKPNSALKVILSLHQKLTYRHILMPLARWTKLARQFYFSGMAMMTINTFRMLACSWNSTYPDSLPPWLHSWLLAASEAALRGRNEGFWGLTRPHFRSWLCLFSKLLYLSLNSVFLLGKKRQRWRWQHWLEITTLILECSRQSSNWKWE